MCIADLYDLRIEEIEPAIAGAWRSVYPLAAVETTTPGESVVNGPFEQGVA